MTPEPRIRRATAADARALADVYLRSRKANAGIPPTIHDDNDVRRHFARLVDTRDVWLAEDADGAPIAVLVLEDDWIDQLYVDPRHQSAGIGAHLVELAKRERPGGLQLWAFQSNTRAIAFYERHGFVEAERTDGAGNEEKAPDVRMVWTPTR